MCAPLTRRQMLRYSAMAAATPLFVDVWRPLEALAADSARAVPMNLELVTLTESSAILTWLTADPTQLDAHGRPAPVPSNTQVFLGDSPFNQKLVVDTDDMTPYHYVELTGLEPGRTYCYRCVSNRRPALPTTATIFPHPNAIPDVADGVFTTPHPPPGEFLFAMAWCNDLHMGEMVSGLAIGNSKLPGGGFPPGYAVDPKNPYWRVMAQATVAEARQRGAQLMMLNGDLTSEAQPIYMTEVKSLFDTFGPYQQSYFVTRGNHDRAHKGPVSAGPPYSTCQTVPGHPEYNDCIRDFFFPDGKTFFSFDRVGIHFVCLDTVNTTTGNGAILPGELEWFREDLNAHSHMPTFVFGHHPITEEARFINVGNTNLGLTPGFNLTNSDAIALERAMAGTSVVGVHNGHTHRNFRTSSPLAPGIPFMELGAVKEYPGGFGIIRVHTGGYALNFYKTRAGGARAWSEMSRGEYLGLYPYYTLGNLADRNFVQKADFSGSARYFRGVSAERALGSAAGAELGGGDLPNTSGDGPAGTAAIAAATAVVAGTALAARRLGGGSQAPRGVPGEN